MNGEVSEVNLNLEDKPDSINKDPYESGWIIKLNNFTNNNDNYLTPNQYKSLIQ